MSESPSNQRLRYAVDEKPSHWLAAALGMQTVILILSGIVLTPVIVLRAAGADAFIGWTVFAALGISGLTTLLQARPIGSFGAGFVLFMGTSGAFMAIAVSAIESGGMPLLATLIVCSSLVQFFFSKHLRLLRRIVTPTVGGIAIMLIAVTIFPISFQMLSQVSDTVVAETPTAIPITVLVTFGVIVSISLFAKGALCLWGPLIGVIVGSFVAQWFGMIDWKPLMEAAWIGLPTGNWPGLDLSFSPAFWLLLPGFILVTIVSAIETYGDAIAIQSVSQRENAPANYKSVQGAVNADGLGNLLSGLAGTLPNTTYSTSIAVVDMTGVAARRVGLYGGLALIVIAFSPKISTLLQAIPAPVAGVYIMILLILLFAHGLKLVTEDGLSYENGVIVGLAFWLGLGFQNKLILQEYLPVWAQSLLGNGMTSGTLVALILMFILSLRDRPKAQLTVPATEAAFSPLHDFTHRLGTSLGWDKAATQRLELIGEEAVVFLLQRQEPTTVSQHQIMVQARTLDDRLELEFACGSQDLNLEHKLTQITDHQEPEVDEIGLRILKRLTQQVQHRQFQDGDLITVHVANDVI